jgi:hypothetical protein
MGEIGMKLMYFDDFRLGVLKADNVVDVSDVVQDVPHIGPHDLINGVIERFAEYRPKIEAAVAGRPGVPVCARYRQAYDAGRRGRRHGQHFRLH